MFATKSMMLAKSLARQSFMFQAVSQRSMETAVDMKINATESKPVNLLNAIDV